MTVALPFARFGPPIFRIKQGNNGPPFEYTTVDENYQLVPITGAILVEFIYRLREALPATAVTKLATLVDAEAGQVRYNWDLTDTVNAGEYYAEWHVTRSDGQVLTFPRRGFLPFVIEERLDLAGT